MSETKNFSIGFSRSGFFRARLVYTFHGPDGKPFLYASKVVKSRAFLLLPLLAGVFIARHWGLLPFDEAYVYNGALLIGVIAIAVISKNPSFDFSDSPGGHATFRLAPVSRLNSANFYLVERQGARFGRVYTAGGLKLSMSYEWVAEDRNGAALLVTKRPASIAFADGPVPVTDGSGVKAGSFDMSQYPKLFSFEFTDKAFESAGPRLVYGFALAVFNHAQAQRLI